MIFLDLLRAERPNTWDPMFSREDEAAAVLRCLRHLVHELRVTAHSVERDLNLTGAQLFVLGELASEPNVSIRRIAERTLTDPSSVSVVVTRLCERGLVHRQQDLNDKRKSLLAITEQGQALLDRAPLPYQTKVLAALRALPRQRLHQLQLGLSALLEGTDTGSRAAPLFFEGTPHENANENAPSKNS